MMIISEERNSFLMNFSAYTNSKKILNGKSSDPLAVLNAVRVLSLSWILIRHYFMLIFYFPHLNATDMNAVRIPYEFPHTRQEIYYPRQLTECYKITRNITENFICYAVAKRHKKLSLYPVRVDSNKF